jgi:hypothetical protein
MMLALLVLSAAPQLVVTPTEILLDGKVVASPNDAPEFLNLPQLQERLHSLPEPAEIHFAPDVTFRIAKRVLYSAARGTATSPSFFVADRGPFGGGPELKVWANVLVTAATKPEAAVVGMRTADAGVGVTFMIVDEVPMSQLAAVMSAAREAGFTQQLVAPQQLMPDGGLPAIPAVGRLGKVNKEKVSKVINSHLYRISSCYTDALQTQPELRGKVVVEFFIGPLGKVVSSRAARVEQLSTGVVTCILDDVQTWKFDPPEGGGVVKITYPFTFKSEDKAAPKK